MKEYEETLRKIVENWALIDHMEPHCISSEKDLEQFTDIPTRNQMEADFALLCSVKEELPVLYEKFTKQFYEHYITEKAAL